MKIIFLNIVADEASAVAQREVLHALPSVQSIVHVRHLGISCQLPITHQQLNSFAQMIW